MCCYEMHLFLLRFVALDYKSNLCVFVCLCVYVSYDNIHIHAEEGRHHRERNEGEVDIRFMSQCIKRQHER